MKIGVLALQGDFLEHLQILERIQIECIKVSLPEHLDGLDGLILPGGESTTIGKLAQAYHLIEPLRSFGQQHAIWGTCAGAIFLARNILNPQLSLELMDIAVERNAFGRQVDSFITDLDVPALAELGEQNPPFPAVFIRAPIIQAVSGTAQTIATLPNGRIVAALQGRLLATSFHPELTADDRFHRFFARLTQ